ncbi:MAG: hypothetical protein H5U13_08930 [Parvibaculum sp.]|nr:hypothetical protein [Parvibaculum sp.]
MLWGAEPGVVDRRGDVLRRGLFIHIAIANLDAAPYGFAGMETLKNLGLDKVIEPEIVKGASITQIYNLKVAGSNPAPATK